jgi:hypothetical protein
VQARRTRQRHRPFLSLSLLLSPPTHPRLFVLHTTAQHATLPSRFSASSTLSQLQTSQHALFISVICRLTPVTSETLHIMSYGGGYGGGGRDGGRGGGYSGYENSTSGSGAYNNYNYSSQHTSYGYDEIPLTPGRHQWRGFWTPHPFAISLLIPLCAQIEYGDRACFACRCRSSGRSHICCNCVESLPFHSLTLSDH